MSEVRLSAEDNVAVLRQGIDLLRRLDDHAYSVDVGGEGRDGVGRQFRHVIDFYACGLAGFAERRLDYARRRRDTRVETERKTAIAALQAIVEALDALNVGDAGTELLVRAERAGDDDRAVWSRSSVERELWFLMSHTIHHYALIKWQLRAQGIDVDPDFGVAPSTLRHWGEGSLQRR